MSHHLDNKNMGPSRIEPVDNVKQTNARLAGLLLSHPSAQFLTPQHQAELQAVFAHGSDQLVYASYRNDVTNCDIAVHLARWDEPGLTTKNKRTFVSPRGDTYAMFMIEVNFNHPTHGSARPELALARIRFWDNVASVASAIQSNEIVYCLIETREQIEERQRKLNDETLREEVKSFISEHVKGMRIGTTRRIDEHGFKLGMKMTVMIGGKTFDIEVRSSVFSPDNPALFVTRRAHS